MAPRIRILLADDHVLLRDSLAEKLERQEDLTVVSCVGNADDALEMAGKLKPDIVLMDIDMPGMVSFEAARQIHESIAGTRVVFLSAFIHDNYIEQALEARAHGYLSKQDPFPTLLNAIREVATGNTYYSDEVRARIVVDTNGARLNPEYHSRCSTLSAREIEVLGYIARGLTGKEIAMVMHISPRTADNHTTRIMTKLDIHSRVELARFAIREGLARA
jgi:two-component system response regulator NreC